MADVFFFFFFNLVYVCSSPPSLHSPINVSLLMLCTTSAIQAISLASGILNPPVLLNMTVSSDQVIKGIRRRHFTVLKGAICFAASSHNKEKKN